MTGVLAHHRCASDLVCTAHHCFYSVHFAKEKGIKTVSLVIVINKERLDSLGADLQTEKEQRRIAGQRLRSKGKLD